MKQIIKNRWNDSVIFELEAVTLKGAVVAAVSNKTKPERKWAIEILAALKPDGRPTQLEAAINALRATEEVSA